MNDKAYSQSNNGLIFQIIGVVVAIIVACVVLIPIVDAMTVTTETVIIPGPDNPDPIGDMRLAYSEDDSLDLSFEVVKSGDSVSITGDYEISGLTGGLILFGSDDYSLVLTDGSLIESINGIGTYVDSVTVTITGGEINGISYTFVYYPSVEGAYANFASYEYDTGEMYSVATFAGTTVASKNGEIVGANPYGFSSVIVTEEDTVTGVEFVKGA